MAPSMLTIPGRPTLKPFALIDRDGTLIVEKNYLSEPNQVELIPGAASALRRLQAMGYGVCLVTNQSGISRGFFNFKKLQQIHDYLEKLLNSRGVKLDGIFVCPHAPEDGCRCRKPMPGLIEQAISVHGFDPRNSWVVGDKEIDVELGRAVGARSILVRTGYGRLHDGGTQADFIVDDLACAANVILGSTARPVTQSI